jgi:nicotinate phosphoribosyltransferase
MIVSLLENDFYKFKMCNYMFHHKYEDIEVEFRLLDRDGTLPNTEVFVDKINEEIKALSRLEWDEHELCFLDESLWRQQLAPVKKYQNFIENFHFDPQRVKVEICEGKLFVSIKASWPEVSMWEVPLMATISELYTIENDLLPTYEQITKKYVKFAATGVPITDFGLRRRADQVSHERMVWRMHRNRMLLGTSNTHIAMKYAIEPIGSMAHEIFMVLAAARKTPTSTTKEVLEEMNDEDVTIIHYKEKNDGK